MYCKKCGTYNSNNSLRCKKCGDYIVNQYLNDDMDDDVIQEKNQEEKMKKEKKKEQNKKNKNSQAKKGKNGKTKRTKTKHKKDRKGLFHKNSHNKQNRNHREEKGSKEVIVKDGCFSRVVIFFLTILVILLVLVCSGLGLYIFDDKVVKMPNVVDLTEEDAIKVLEDNDLSYNIRKEKVQNDDDIGIVLEQDKKVGSYILKNKTVTITVGSDNDSDADNDKDDKNDVLENLVGMTKNEAINLLQDANIRYTITEIESDEKEGIVIKQDPTSGSILDKNKVVTLYISKAKENSKNDDSSNIATDDDSSSQNP